MSSRWCSRARSSGAWVAGSSAPAASHERRRAGGRTGRGPEPLLDHASSRSASSCECASRADSPQKLRVSEGRRPPPVHPPAARRARGAGGGGRGAAKARRDVAERAEEAPADAKAPEGGAREGRGRAGPRDRKSTRLNSSHLVISYAVFCLKKKKKPVTVTEPLRTSARTDQRVLTTPRVSTPKHAPTPHTIPRHYAHRGVA